MLTIKKNATGHIIAADDGPPEDPATFSARARPRVDEASDLAHDDRWCGACGLAYDADGTHDCDNRKGQ